MTVALQPNLLDQPLQRAITGDQLIYVVDSSNIEARMLAWEAGHDDLLEQFRQKQDVYSNFASQVYGYPVNKYDHPDERFLGKTCILGLGFQVGWKKLQGSLATADTPMFIDERRAREIVALYRSINAPITRYWQQAEAAIADMYLGNERDWGPLRIYKNALILPNGMALQYPGLRPVAPSEDGSTFGGWEYWNGKHWTNLYGGKLCLAKGTLVLTREGWTKIEEIQPNTEVWDGTEWVSCDGNVYNGDKPVIELAGVAMTPDHEVLTDEGWKTASQIKGHNRAESGLPHGEGIRWQRWEEIPLADPVHLRDDQSPARHRAEQDEKARGSRLLWLQKARINLPAADAARDVQTPGLRRLALHDRPLHAALASCLGQLRRAGHTGLQAVAGLLRSLLGGHGAYLPAGADSGSHRQRPALRAGQLPLGHVCHSSQQPQNIGAGQRQDGKAAIQRNGDRGVHAVVSAREWLALGQAIDSARRNQPVYDLINCGPRNRFVVRDGNGHPLIVHNCENITQALARIVLFGQMLKINDLLRPHNGRVVLNVHDEIVSVGPSFGATYLGKFPDEKGKLKDRWTHTEKAQALFEQMVTIMRTPPDWCPDLPLDGEGGFAFEYSK